VKRVAGYERLVCGQHPSGNCWNAEHPAGESIFYGEEGRKWAHAGKWINNLLAPAPKICYNYTYAQKSSRTLCGRSLIIEHLTIEPYGRQRGPCDCGAAVPVDRRRHARPAPAGLGASLPPLFPALFRSGADF